jgi:glutaminase
MRAATAAQTPLHDLLLDMIARFGSNHAGEVATYIPELARADPDWFGICLVTTDGTAYEVGGSRQSFTIQSISKPFAYALALEERGPEVVRQRVGVEPSGDAFNSISLQPGSGRPLNPMINAGAIAISSLLNETWRPAAQKKLLDWFGGFVGGSPVAVDETVYASEAATGHRNRAIAHLMRNFDVVADPVEEGVDLYFRQCSILVTCHDLAVMAATLANHGMNPVTGRQVMSARYVEDVLSVMTTCGMYNYAGQWLFDVGVPAKSGVAGGILAVLPGRMGIGVFSPRLDAQGNSVRGIQVCQELSERFGLHLFNSMRTGRSVIRREMTLQYRPSSRVRPAEEAQRLKTLGESVLLLEMQGDLHFSALEVVQRHIWDSLPTARIILLDFTHVDTVDAAVIDGLARLTECLSSNDRQVVFSGLALDEIARRELVDRCAMAAMYADLDSGLEACEDSLLGGGPVGQNGHAAFATGLAVAELDVAKTLEDAELRVLERLFVRRRLDRSECICRQGDDAAEVYFLTRGEVSVRLYGGPTTFQRLAAFAPGTVFGELAVIDRGTRSADVWTETEVEFLTLSVEDFERLAVEHPSLKIKMLQYFLRTLATRLRRANDLIGQLSA